MSLAGRLRRRIETLGPIDLGEYMQLALADPEAGYYTTGEPFGAAGDFTTAPEISQMFGELVGLWAAFVWRQMGAPDPVLLIELGPGRGTMLADALRATAAAPAFRRALRLHLVETSPMLRRRQQEALTGAEASWHDAVATLPDGPAILLANEFVDALPIRQLQRTPLGWQERLVDRDKGGGFRFVLAMSPLAALVPAALASAPIDAVIELSPARLALADALARRLVALGGAALIIDYGYAASVPGDTLQAVKGHRPHPPLEDPGTADLTAHVDFAAFAAAATEAGATVHGPIDQGVWLERLGIGERAKRLAPARAGVWDDLRRLIDADEMGTLFKALALTPPGQSTPPGFE
ncbi:MAG: SAM-dependent methyltransferase [Proteobacteria bacterium]|nr:SAM-dependent methyltransferase [Pseudomonadota bacterium]MBI3497638.1 SAM-dependent methyltransferase [Pseudomonadota bacterium]